MAIAEVGGKAQDVMVHPAPCAPLKGPGDPLEYETVARRGSKGTNVVVTRVDATTLTRRFKGLEASPRGSRLGHKVYSQNHNQSALKEDIYMQGDAGIHVQIPSRTPTQLSHSNRWSSSRWLCVPLYIN